MKKSEQNVRGTVVLPHGTGQKKRVIVFAKGEKAKEAQKRARTSSAIKISSIGSRAAGSIST